MQTSVRIPATNAARRGVEIGDKLAVTLYGEVTDIDQSTIELELSHPAKTNEFQTLSPEGATANT